ncbi:MAG: thioredoxin family protein [Rhodocyclaceae bacterium]|nr:thioredoxin family protein [Rhodocyclaceae bacterium]
MSASPVPRSRLTIACLCAAWCRTCDAYREVFDAAAAESRAGGRAVSAHWIDIEDQAALVGDLDVETFPTLLVLDAGGVRFFGPLEPQPETLRRMLRSAVEAAAAGVGPAAVAPAVSALAERLAGR